MENILNYKKNIELLSFLEIYMYIGDHIYSLFSIMPILHQPKEWWRAIRTAYPLETGMGTDGRVACVFHKTSRNVLKSRYFHSLSVLFRLLVAA